MSGTIFRSQLDHHHITTRLLLLLVALLLCASLSGALTLCNEELCLGGVCNTENGTEVCQCAELYPNCTKPANTTCAEVGPDYCLNGAACSVDSNGDITCGCTTGFSGSRCERSQCDTSLCSSQGDCTVGLTPESRTCDCQACFTGDNCSLPKDLCTVPPPRFDCVVVHGTCATHCPSGVPEQYCNCFRGFTGATCAVDQNECTLNGANPCLNGATCNDMPGNFNCTCTAGFNGDICDQDIDECALPGYCDGPNTAGCNNTFGSAVCSCKLGYKGDNCAVPTCDDDPEICRNNGTCVSDSTSWSCDCPTYYEGERCEIVGPCLSGPCQYGTCSQSNDTGALLHFCDCDEGWMNNQTCADNIDECSVDSALCNNGGVCTDTPGNFTCNCTEFWTGRLCMEDVLECSQAPPPCGTGSCIEQDGGYTCDCTETGYEGRHCETNIDECSRQAPCRSPAQCLDSPGNFTCHCTSGWLGRLCDVKDWCFDSCELNNTVDGRSCENLADRANCTCAEGYIDIDCSIMSACNSAPCENRGSCTDVFAAGSVPGNRTAADVSFSCECPPKFTGSSCQSVVDTGMEEPQSQLGIYIGVPIAAAVLLALIIGSIVCFIMARKKRATRGRYSPSRNEIIGPNLQLSGVLKPPPEERLI